MRSTKTKMLWQKFYEERFPSKIEEQLQGTEVFGLKFLGRPDEYYDYFNLYDINNY